MWVWGERGGREWVFLFVVYIGAEFQVVGFPCAILHREPSQPGQPALPSRSVAHGVHQDLRTHVHQGAESSEYSVVGSSPTRGSSFFLGKVTALGVLCCFALFIALFLPSFFICH